MKVGLGLYRCAEGVVEAPLLSDFFFGAVLSWSPAREVILLELVDNPIFDEFLTLYEEAVGPMDDNSSLHGFFGELAADPSPAGLRYGIAFPPCPETSKSPLAWDRSTSREMAEVASATYSLWSALKLEERRLKIGERLAKT